MATALKCVPSNWNEPDLIKIKILIEKKQLIEVSLFQALTKRNIKSLKFCVTGWDGMLNICNKCEIRESSAGFIHSLTLGISYLKGEESQLSDKIMIGSLIKPVSSIQEKCRVGKNSLSLQITGFYTFTFLSGNNTTVHAVLYASCH